MSNSASTGGSDHTPSANNSTPNPDALLNKATTFWWAVMLVGQWLFLSYIIAFYGGAALGGDMMSWNENMSRSYVPGDFINNLAATSHLVLAVIIMGGGPLQLVSQIRARFPAFHRILGRTYLLAVVTTAIVGIYMLATRDIGGNWMYAGFVLQVILVLWFAAMSFRHALARRIAIHRRWALRLFMVASAVWFFRVILMSWLPLTGGIGVDFETGLGWFLDFMSFGQYIPLLILEAYFRVQDRGGLRGKRAMAISLFLLTIMMAGGILGAFVFMWLPSM